MSDYQDLMSQELKGQLARKLEELPPDTMPASTAPGDVPASENLSGALRQLLESCPGEAAVLYRRRWGES